jgi:curved DNA-binding protein CbpA
MLKSYLILGLSLNATDQEIRKKYLRLVKEHSPEKNPEMFQEITNAYESIKDARTRAKTALVSALKNVEPRQTIETLASSVKITRRTPGLQALLNAVGKGMEK